MSNTLKFAVLGLILIGCMTPGEIISELVYTKDVRTDLCFASRCLGTKDVMFTNVPCTPDVERLLVK